MESHCNIPTIKPHIAQCQSYFLTSMFHSFFTHKQKSCTPFSIHPSCNLPLSKLQLLFQVFLHSSCTCLKEQFKSKSKELNTHNANAIFLLWHPSSTPKQLQLLFYVKTKIITHTYTSQKSFFWIAKSMFYFNSEESTGFVSLWITYGSSRTHPLMQHTKWKKTLHIPWTRYNFSSLRIDMLLSHTQQNKNKNPFLHIHLLYVPLYSNWKEPPLNPTLCLATNKKQCKNIKRLYHSTSAIKLTIDDKFVYNATNCHNKLKLWQNDYSLFLVQICIFRLGNTTLLSLFLALILKVKCATLCVHQR
jgi:hypothetical protein